MKKFEAEDYEDKFSTQIIERGEEYYEEGRVEKCCRTNYGFVAKVNGTVDYIVEIHNLEGEVVMSCTCPFPENCKHEYATLLAIENEEYCKTNLTLLPEEVRECDFETFIDNIPADKLKDFIKDIMQIEYGFTELKEILQKKFFKYLPKENKEFYYNKVYNKCVFEEEYVLEIVHDYLMEIGKYIDFKDYTQVFVIYSAIIDAVYDSNIKMSNFEKIELYSKLGIYARMTCRKGNKKLRLQIEKWLETYNEKHFKNSKRTKGDLYLEELLLDLKDILNRFYIKEN